MDHDQAFRARHDIRGHLNAIGLFGTLAATAETPGEQLDCLGTIEQQADAVIALVDRYELADVQPPTG